MSSVLSHRVIHVTDFKKNPAQAVRDASPLPLAVVNRSRLEFYAVEPQVYAAMVERLPSEEAEELARSLTRAVENVAQSDQISPSAVGAQDNAR